jgi:putative ABC transport system ATP-binding protein
VQDNMLFGRMVYGQAQAAARIGKLIGEVLDELKLRGAVLRIGLEYQVGIAGKRLSHVQRQKLGLARALLKRPHYLIINEAVSLIDTVGQTRILANLLKASEGRTVLWVLRHPRDAEAFKRLIVLKDGRIAEQGPAKELLARKAKAAEGMAAQ